MEKMEKQGFFSSIFKSKNKGCGCGITIEDNSDIEKKDNKENNCQVDGNNKRTSTSDELK